MIFGNLSEKSVRRKRKLSGSLETRSDARIRKPGIDQRHNKGRQKWKSLFIALLL
jgi:hypothetical protein